MSKTEPEAGERIDCYKLLEKIGEGGCGIVYMAEQEETVRRRFPLKVIKPGMDTREVIVRFEAERQALALMEHPHIAKVFDGGATDAGRPYFVMELVRGHSGEYQEGEREAIGGLHARPAMRFVRRKVIFSDHHHGFLRLETN